MNNLHPVFEGLLKGIAPQEATCINPLKGPVYIALDNIHAMIHDAAFALSNGNIAEVERLHKAIDIAAHNAMEIM